MPTGAVARSPGTACASPYVDSARAEVKLLRDNNAAPVECPILGTYYLKTSVANCHSSLEVSCTDKSDLTLNLCNDISKLAAGIETDNV